jgi:hypothetical protein
MNSGIFFDYILLDKKHKNIGFGLGLSYPKKPKNLEKFNPKIPKV